MRNIWNALYIAIALGLASPALAQVTVADNAPQGAPTDNGPAVTPQTPKSAGPSLTLYQGFGSGYIYQDFGIMASNHAVAEGGATFNWKSGDNLDFWYSSGAGGAADEIDVSYWHDGSFTSPIGPMTYEAKLAYYFLNSGGGKLFAPVDDALYAHLDLGRTFNVGSATVGLHSKTEIIEGLNNLPFVVVERVGVPVDFNIADNVSAEIEGAKAWNLTGNGYSPWELTPAVTWKVSDTVSVIAKDKMAYANRKALHEALVEVDWQVN